MQETELERNPKSIFSFLSNDTGAIQSEQRRSLAPDLSSKFVTTKKVDALLNCVPKQSEPSGYDSRSNDGPPWEGLTTMMRQFYGLEIKIKEAENELNEKHKELVQIAKQREDEEIKLTEHSKELAKIFERCTSLNGVIDQLKGQSVSLIEEIKTLQSKKAEEEQSLNRLLFKIGIEEKALQSKQSANSKSLKRQDSNTRGGSKKEPGPTGDEGDEQSEEEMEEEEKDSLSEIRNLLTKTEDKLQRFVCARVEHLEKTLKGVVGIDSLKEPITEAVSNCSRAAFAEITAKMQEETKKLEAATKRKTDEVLRERQELKQERLNLENAKGDREKAAKAREAEWEAKTSEMKLSYEKQLEEMASDRDRCKKAYDKINELHIKLFNRPSRIMSLLVQVQRNEKSLDDAITEIEREFR